MKVKISHSPTSNESQELDLSLTTQKGKEWIVGRSPDSDVFLDSYDVSRLHGKFFFQGGNYYFSDIGSRNGSMINGKLTEKNQAYILRDKDIIRIGDFMLVMEETISLSQQAETVVRIISPSQFSNWRSNENANNVSVESQTPPEVATPVAEESLSTPPTVETPEVVDSVIVESQTPPEVAATPVAEESLPTPPTMETPEVVDSVSVENQTPPEEAATPVAEESLPTPSTVETPVAEEFLSEPTLIQLESTYSQAEAIATNESTIQQDEVVIVTSSISNEATDTATPAESEVTADVGGAIPPIEHPDFTYVQPRNIINQSPEEIILEESTNESISAASDENELTENNVTKTINDVTSEPKELDYTIIQPRNISDQFPEEKTTPETIDELDEAVIIVASENTEDLVLDNTESLQTTETETPISTQDLEEVEAATLPVAIISESDSVNETSEEVSQTEPASVSEYPESLAQKRIVLIAHETKKSELVELVVEYQKFFSICQTLAWSSISEVLHQQAGITTSQQIPTGTSGYQSIASLISSGDVSAVIFLRDFLQPQPGQANEDAMLRLCNINEVLVATNVVTARAIVHYVSHIESKR